MLNYFWRLAPIETGPYWHARQYVDDEMRRLNVKPGDIVCRLGNSVVYGFFWFSKFIANLTGSNYSHAGMVISVDEEDILLADVNTTGLRRQFLVDWVDDVRGDDILVLRHNDPVVARLAVENAKAVISLDPKYDSEFLDNDDGKNFYCVELVSWCYLRAGVLLCKEVPICELPGWKKRYNLFAKTHGIDVMKPVWCVGNKDIGLISSPYLTEVGRISLNNKQYSCNNILTFRGA